MQMETTILVSLKRQLTFNSYWGLTTLESYDFSCRFVRKKYVKKKNTITRLENKVPNV